MQDNWQDITGSSQMRDSNTVSAVRVIPENSTT